MDGDKEKTLINEWRKGLMCDIWRKKKDRYTKEKESYVYMKIKYV